MSGALARVRAVQGQHQGHRGARDIALGYQQESVVGRGPRPRGQVPGVIVVLGTPGRAASRAEPPPVVSVGGPPHPSGASAAAAPTAEMNRRRVQLFGSGHGIPDEVP